MSKKIELILPYREKGEKKDKFISIDFVCNQAVKDYNYIFECAVDVKTSWDRIKSLSDELVTIESERPEGWKDRKTFLRSEAEGLTKRITKYNDGFFFDVRFNLLKMILEDNGIKDEELFTEEFWNRKVDPADLMEFLAACIYKDNEPSKKKANQARA